MSEIVIWWFTALLALILVEWVVRTLYLHPLRGFPGPRIAALGSYLEFYYDVMKDGTYLWEIEKMHEKYGPVVRINADELHIRDPDYYSTVYAGPGHRINKYGSAVAAYTVPRASIATVDHDLHRIQQVMISPYFSLKSIKALEPLIDERIDRLCERLDERRRKGIVVELDGAFAALTYDVITAYFYGSHQDELANDELKSSVRDAVVGLIGFYHFSRFLPFLASALKHLPIPISEVDIKKKMRDPALPVCHNALKDPSLPTEENDLDRLVDEGKTIIFAGTETTTRALSVAHMAALAPGPCDEYSYSELTGVINEALRFTHGVSARLPRISVDEPLRFGEWVIPPGTVLSCFQTPVSMSSPLQHMDPSIFPNPRAFNPGRWIRAAEDGMDLSKYMVSFTKGSRACLGIHMAYAEMYLVIARIIRRFELELHDTTGDDVEVYHIRLTGYPRKGLGDIKVRVVGDNT
ncbi:cytochrome protein [Apodospora peruviana]|uniref:Cytochrome protein n=1 Tax=Apodospora peruviana TaxID=516989 RepID=A0AAE0MBT6_9PEZI|nr:cytochrome protein [Apodospora peruviana]